METGEAIREIGRVVPHLGLLMGVGLLGLLIEVVVIARAHRYLELQRGIMTAVARGDLEGFSEVPRTPGILVGLAAGVPLGLAGAVLMVIGAARARILGAMAAPIESDRLGAFASGLGGMLNGVALSAPIWGVVTATACVAVGLSLSARGRAIGLDHAVALRAHAPEEAAAWARHPGFPTATLVASILLLMGLGLLPILAVAHRSSVESI